MLWPRARARVAIVCALQMYAYVAAYKMPNDDAAALEARVHVDYPIRADRLLGFGELPTRAPAARAASRRILPRLREGARLGALGLVRHAARHAGLPATSATATRFARAAVLTYAVFDIGVIAYWLAPTAPPWYAATQGRAEDCEPVAVRRLMVEYGESFWRNGWAPLYAVFGGNPLAAMPSLHFATSTMAALLLAESSPGAGRSAAATPRAWLRARVSR